MRIIKHQLHYPTGKFTLSEEREKIEAVLKLYPKAKMDIDNHNIWFIDDA